MTTDTDLTDYARAEAETRWPQHRTGHYVQQLAFVAGAEWARTHLAAQERKAQAEALRDTADWWAANPDDDAFETPGDTRNWMRDVAEEYEAGDQ